MADEEEFTFPNVEYPLLLDYAETIMDERLGAEDFMGIHEMSEDNPSFPEGGISDRDAHVVDAIMSLVTVVYSWPTPEEVQAKVRKALKEPEEK